MKKVLIVVLTALILATAVAPVTAQVTSHDIQTTLTEMWEKVVSADAPQGIKCPEIFFLPPNPLITGTSFDVPNMAASLFNGHELEAILAGQVTPQYKIYVNQRFLDDMDCEDVLPILAHELGHVINNHPVALGEKLAELLDPPVKLLQAAGFTGSSLMQKAQILAQILMGHPKMVEMQRQAEREADQYCVDILVILGQYHLSMVASLIKAAPNEDIRAFDWDKTHGGIPERAFDMEVYWATKYIHTK